VLLATERLRLRPLTVSDAPALAAVYDDPEVVAFLSPLDLAGTVAQLAAFSAEWEQRGHGLYAVERACDGALLGRSGLHYWPSTAETEVGWVLGRAAWGHGYAREAATAVLAHGFDDLHLAEIVAYIVAGNVRSERVAAALGFTNTGLIRLGDKTVQRFARSSAATRSPRDPATALPEP
jgi:RimJ/RimL family protein N-acetyltransferase